MGKPMSKTGDGVDASYKAKPQVTVTIAFGKVYQPILRRYVELVNKFPNSISLSGLIAVAAAASIDTFEKEVPNKRTFMLNGKKVEV